MVVLATDLLSAYLPPGPVGQGTQGIQGIQGISGVSLASPALTGTPTAPTAAVGTNTTQLATTAFVNAEIANDIGTSTAGLAYGAIGTYAFLGSISTVAASTTLANPGDTLSGSTLAAIGVYSFGTAGVQIHGSALSGTWRVMGFLRNISASNAHQVGTVCLRIA